MDLAFLDKEANLRKASEMVREAAANGASLICLPEAFNTGYLGSDIPAMKKMAEPLDCESVTVMRKLAAELSVYLVAPIIYAAANGEAENTAVFNNCVFYNSGGGDAGATVHLFRRHWRCKRTRRCR